MTKIIDPDMLGEHVQPNPSAATRGIEAREHRRSTEKQRVTIRLDAHIIEQFKALAGDAGYQRLVNQALHDWLSAQSVAQLVREELQHFRQSATETLEKTLHEVSIARP